MFPRRQQGRFTVLGKLLIFWLSLTGCGAALAQDGGGGLGPRLSRLKFFGVSPSPEAEKQQLSEPSVVAGPQFEDLKRHGQELPNFRTVDRHLLRGGQPTMQGLVILKQAGVKTIVNLRTEPNVVAQEKVAVEKLGMKFINIPMYIFEQPGDEQFRRFLSIAGNANSEPVFVHCQHGQDRTGTMVGAYRISVNKWNFDTTFEEMLSIGYRPGLVQLTRGLHAFAQAQGDKSAMPSNQIITSDLKKRLNGLKSKYWQR